MPNLNVLRFFKGIGAKTKLADSSENSVPKSNKNEPSKRKRSIAILDDEEIEELQSTEISKNTFKGLSMLFVAFKPVTMIDIG